MTGRPSTPVRTTQPSTLAKSPLTPGQVQRIEENRLKAKAIRAQREASSNAPQTLRTPSGFLAGQKRPHASISGPSSSSAAATVQPTQRDARNDAIPKFGHSKDDGIQAAQKFQKYVEYDFSKMTDTKGGFLSAQDDPFNRALHVSQGGKGDEPQKPAHMTLKEWERQRLLHKLREQRAGPFEPGLSALADKDDQGQDVQRKCRECGSLEIDWKWDEVFGCRICNGCKEKLPEKYSLLTKTEAREDYLLTDPELRDEELLPHMERPNPHKSNWNNMMLYLRYQVEEYAFSDKKWGSPGALDEEFERREGEKKRRKEEKFKNKLNELKKRTRVEAYKRGRKGEGMGGEFGDRIAGGRHEHEWGRTVENESGVGTKTCVECGMEVEELEF